MKKCVVLLFMLLSLFCMAALAETEGDYTYEIQADGTARITKYSVPEKPEAILIPETLGGAKVTAIANFAFDDDQVVTVQIPNTVTTIEGMAFFGASQQLRVMIPKNHPTLAEIDRNIYDKPTRTLVLGLNPNLNIPEGIQAIGKNACSMRTYTRITLPKSLKMIGDEAFGGASAPAFPLQEGIEVIGKQAFHLFECTGEAQSLVLPSTLKSLGDEAFMEVKIKMGFTRTDNRAHGSECRAKNSQDEYLQIVIPEGMEYLGQGTFQNIIIHSKGRKSFDCVCTEIDRSWDEARQDTQAILSGKPKGRYSAEVTSRGIVQVAWPKDQGNIPEAMFWQSGEAFMGGSIKKAYMHVTLPNTGDVRVGSHAFGGCVKVTFENACILTQVGDGAFSACYNVVFSQGVKLVSAGKDAFYDAKVEGDWQLDESMTQWPFNNAKIEIKEIPAHITTLDENALIMFHKDLYLHSGLTNIHEKAFTARTTFQVEAYTYAAEWVMTNNRQFTYVEPEDDLSWLSGGDSGDDLSWLNPEGDTRYEEAKALEEAGDYEGAKAIYEELGDHKDAPQRLEEMNRRLAYEKAEALEEAGDYQAAYEAFVAMGDFEDSAQRAQRLAVYPVIAAAETKLQEGHPDEAKKALEPYKDHPAAQPLYKTLSLRCAELLMTAFNSEGWAVAREGKTNYYLLNIEGDTKELNGAEYRYSGWQDGLMLLNNQEGYLYVDLKGDAAFGKTFKKAEAFHQGKALVTGQDGAVCVIDTSGQTVAQMPEVNGRSYETYAGENLVRFKEKDKYGLINLEGKVVVKAKYTKSISKFEHGLAVTCTQKGKKYAYSVINPKGKAVIKEGKYEVMNVLSENLIACYLRNDTWGKGKTYPGVINLKGKTVLKGEYNNKKYVRVADLIMLETSSNTGTGWTVYDKEGKYLMGYVSNIQPLVSGDGKRVYIENWKGGVNQISLLYHPDQWRRGYGGCQMAPDSPYIALKTKDGWHVYDLELNLIN